MNEIQYDAYGRIIRCAKYEHDFDGDGSFGVIIGVSRCRKCGTVALSSDFATSPTQPPRSPTSGSAGRSGAMGKCEHTSKEQHEALESVARGLLDAFCPLCLRTQLDEAQAKLARFREAFGTDETVAALRAELDIAKAALKMHDVASDRDLLDTEIEQHDMTKEKYGAAVEELESLRADLARKTEALKAIVETSGEGEPYPETKRVMIAAAALAKPKAGDVK